MRAPEYARIVGFRGVFGLALAFILEIVLVGTVGFPGVFHMNLYITREGVGGSIR